jgi:thymidylate synthase
MSKKEQILREILNIYKIQAIDLSIMYKIEFGDDVIDEIKRLQDLLEEESSIDRQYQALLKDILDNGVEKKDRTGTGTLSVFGRQIRHRMSDGFPVLTTKKMAWKTMVTELIWFLSRSTNIKFLVDNGCHIWDGDCFANYLKNRDRFSNKDNVKEDVVINGMNGSSNRAYTQEEFIDKIKTDDEFAKKWGELGPVYGKQWRSWGKDFKQVPNETGDKVYHITTTGIDQIANLINDLKTNPDSRRLMVNAWNVGQLDQMVLPPCHYGFQVYTRELSKEERIQIYVNQYMGGVGKPAGFEDAKLTTRNIPARAISLMWNQRSVDTFLGLPFNIASYGLLLEIIAKEVNMVPDELIGNLGDVHLYSNHIEQAKEQISREPYPLPKLIINDEFWNHEHQTIDGWIKGMEIGDFTLEGYQSHPKINATLSN